MNSATLPFHAALLIAISAALTFVPDRTAFALPADLAPYFQPPATTLEKSDPRRSPLVRPDGTRVTTAAEWARERGIPVLIYPAKKNETGGLTADALVDAERDTERDALALTDADRERDGDAPMTSRRRNALRASS